MKIINLLILVLMINSFTSHSSNYSVIYFYRLKSNAESKKAYNLYINGVNIGSIKSNGRIKYVIYSYGEAEIYAKSPDCETTRIYLNIEPNSEHYIKVDGITCFLKEFGIDKGRYDFTNPNNFSKSIVEMNEDISNPLPFKKIPNNNIANVGNKNLLLSSERQELVNNQNELKSLFSCDVDTNIPINTQDNNNTFVVIIANENYQKEVKVEYAINDGKVFKEYCEKTLGIPSKNIHIVLDATYGNMKSEIKWINDVASVFKYKAKVIFYYAGHGTPNESDRSAYLLPVDGFSSDYETAISLNELYSRLCSNSSKNITVFLDACFSGSVRDEGMLSSARGVKIKPKVDIVNGNMIVLSASTGDETAYPFKEKQHGLFTYFLLKKLQETNGNVDYQTLFEYVNENVKQQSILVNQKSQTPQIIVSPDMDSTWRTTMLKSSK